MIVHEKVYTFSNKSLLVWHSDWMEKSQTTQRRGADMLEIRCWHATDKLTLMRRI